MKTEIMEKTRAAQKAGQKPFTANPLTIVEVSQKTKPLIIRVKKPRVKILIGRVSKTINGLMKALMIAITKTAAKAL